MSDDFSALKKAVDPFGSLSVPWFICGGWALSLFLGKCLRIHGDLDIGMFRHDSSTLYAYFPKASFRYMTPGVGAAQAWHGEQLELPVHEIHFEDGPRAFEALLNEHSSENWIYRRNRAIKCPLPTAVMADAGTGLRYLAPEIVLLYKSKHMREKDIADYAAIMPHLPPVRRQWLFDALRVDYPQGHLWLESQAS